MFDSPVPHASCDTKQSYQPDAVVRPSVTIRAATIDELAAADVWSLTHGCYNEPLDVVSYKYGEMTHSAEVIEAFKDFASRAPKRCC